MKSFILNILFIGCITMFSNAQISFYKTYTGGLYDVGQGGVELPDSSYAITGSTSSLSSTSSQAMLMVVDSLGNHQWTKGYGGDEADWGRRIFYRENEGFWIFGYSSSYGDGSFDMTIWRIDEQGDLIWDKIFPTTSWYRLWDAIELPNGDFVISGEIEGDETMDKDILIHRVTDEGDVVWEKYIENEGDDVPYALSLYDDTTVIVAGEYYQNDQKNGIILNLHTDDGETNTQWIYDEDGPASFRTVDVYDGLIFPAGAVNTTTMDYVNTVILKVDLDYNVISKYITPYEEDDYASSISVVDEERLLWVMYTESPHHNVFPGGPDAILLKFHVDLYFFFLSMPLSGYDPDEIHQIIKTSDGGALLIGFCSDDRNQSSAGSNVMLMKVGPNDETTGDPDSGNDLVNLEDEKLETKIGVYPNPFSSQLNLKAEEPIEKIDVFSYDGRKVQFTYENNMISLINASKGTYFLRVHFKNSIQTKKIIKN